MISSYYKVNWVNISGTLDGVETPECFGKHNFNSKVKIINGYHSTWVKNKDITTVHQEIGFDLPPKNMNIFPLRAAKQHMFITRILWFDFNSETKQFPFFSNMSA